MTSRILDIIPPTDIQSLDDEMTKLNEGLDHVTQHKLDATNIIRSWEKEREAEVSHFQQKDMEARI